MTNPFPLRFEVRDQDDDSLVNIINIANEDEYEEQAEIAEVLGFYLAERYGDDNE